MSFPLNRVIAGWTEGVQLMVAGETRRWIRSARLSGPSRSERRLVFDVELLSIVKAPSTPSDVKAPPADAKKTASGLATTGAVAGNRQSVIERHQPGDRALHGLDDRRQDVRTARSRAR